MLLVYAGESEEFSDTVSVRVPTPSPTANPDVVEENPNCTRTRAHMLRVRDILKSMEARSGGNSTADGLDIFEATASTFAAVGERQSAAYIFQSAGFCLDEIEELPASLRKVMDVCPEFDSLGISQITGPSRLESDRSNVSD